MASGIWNVRELTIMATFAENYDFTGKTIRPVTTHAMSGLGTTEKDYARTCPGAVLGEGLAVRARKSGMQDRTSNRGSAASGCSPANGPAARR